jgi:hypothetical protein
LSEPLRGFKSPRYTKIDSINAVYFSKSRAIESVRTFYAQI